MPNMIRRWPILTAVLIQPLLVTLALLLSRSARAQDAAPADRPGYAIEPRQPVVMVSWNDAQTCIQWLNSRG